MGKAELIGTEEEGALARRGQPAVPDAFPEGEGLLPSNPLIVAGLEAMYKGGPNARSLSEGWGAGPGGRLAYVRSSHEGGRIIVYPSLSEYLSHPHPTAESEWEFVTGLSAFTSDVALAVLAQLCEPIADEQPVNPLVDPVRITADAVLRYKGIRRSGRQREDLYMRVAEEIGRLQAIRFHVERYLGQADGDGEGISWRADRLFDIVEVEHWRERQGSRDRVDVVWLVRAGQWAKWWLQPRGRLWVAHMAQALLELDHRENRPAEVMAKKIGQRIALANEALYYRGPICLRIDYLLEHIGELPTQGERAKHWAGRTRDRFDEAMLLLQEARLFSSVRWPLGYGPGDSDRSRGWVNRWLEARVEIGLPNPAVEALPARSPRGVLELLQPPRSAPAASLGPALRQAMSDRNISQTSIARYFGISQSYLSRIVNGERDPSPELGARIASWLAEDTEL